MPLFYITAALLIVAYIFMPVPNDLAMSPATLEDFQIPDNTNSKVVPKVYGTTYIKGNCIWYDNLKSKAIKSGGK
jgi:hypothetical protein